MANTVNSLNYANTFVDWVNATNLTTIELNSLGKGTYTKDTGTLILNGSSEALRANGPVNLYNSLISIIGIGSSAYVQNGLTVGGTTILNGGVYYSSNTLTLSASGTTGQISYLNVNRGSSGANASIRWNEANKYFDILDVNSSNYFRILTTNTITDSVTTTSSVTAASATAVNNVNNTATSAYTQANTATSNASAAASVAASAFNQANTASSSSIKTIGGTTGTATPSSSVVSILGDNGVTAVATSNTVTISTPQDLRTTASPTFANVQCTQVNSQSSINFVAMGVTSTNNSTLYNYSGISSNNASGFGIATLSGGTFLYSTTGNFTASGNITAYSDARLKTNVQTITGALDKVSALRGVTFEKDGTKGLGVIAQEIQKILPEVVLEGNDENKTLSVAYGNIVGLLIEAIKELKDEINTLKGNTNG